jgi:hypothetical protein
MSQSAANDTAGLMARPIARPHIPLGPALLPYLNRLSRSACRFMPRLRPATLEKPQVEHHKYRDNSDVCYQPFPQVVFKEQDVHADNNGDQCQHVKQDGSTSSHRLVLLRENESSNTRAAPNIRA